MGWCSKAHRQTLSVVLRYKTGLFEVETIRQMLGHFQRILENAAAGPDSPIAKFNEVAAGPLFENMIRILRPRLRADLFILAPVVLLASICWLGLLVVFVYLSAFGSGWTIRLSSLAGAALLICFVTARVVASRPLTLLSIPQASLLTAHKSAQPPFALAGRSGNRGLRSTWYSHYQGAFARGRFSRTWLSPALVIDCFRWTCCENRARGGWRKYLNPSLYSRIASRGLGLTRVAKKLVAEFPAGQQAVLLAYTEGVNSYMAEKQSRPFEFRVLHYHPEPWELKDSLLVLLQMFRVLSEDQKTKRMLTVMDRRAATRGSGVSNTRFRCLF